MCHLCRTESLSDVKCALNIFQLIKVGMKWKLGWSFGPFWDMKPCVMTFGIGNKFRMGLALVLWEFFGSLQA